jgi:hypothetical protein
LKTRRASAKSSGSVSISLVSQDLRGRWSGIAVTAGCWLGRRVRGEHCSDFAGGEAAQGRDFGGVADQLAQVVERRSGGLPWSLGGQVRVGEEAVCFLAGVSAELFGVAGGLKVVGEDGFDVFLAAELGGVAGCFGLLGAAQGGGAGG